SNTRKEVPLLAHRLRKAVLKGAAAMFLCQRRYEFLFPIAAYLNVASQDMASSLAAVLKAALGKKTAPVHLKDFVKSQQTNAQHEKIASELLKGERKAILLGHLALQHPAYADIRALAAVLAEVTGASLGYISEGANSAGAWLAGAVPHRIEAGKKSALKGLDAHTMFAQPRRSYVLMGVEPELDCWDSAAALAALDQAKSVVLITPFVTDAMKDYASVLLPACTFSETSGTYVNGEGRWQSFTGMTKSLGEARPAWKILRVLGNLSELAGFDYQTSEEARDELKKSVGDLKPDNRFISTRIVKPHTSSTGFQCIAEIPLYSVDMLARRAKPLQETRDADAAWLRMSLADGKKLGLLAGESVTVKHNGAQLSLPVKLDESVAAGNVWLPAGVPVTAGFGPFHTYVEVEKS
ncbi:MAG: molybdopterin-dependent oxidoreductase, partial [Gammaproteobacteria bacterium]